VIVPQHRRRGGVAMQGQTIFAQRTSLLLQGVIIIDHHGFGFASLFFGGIKRKRKEENKILEQG